MTTRKLPAPKEIEHATDILRLLADRTRLSIMIMLDGQEMSVGQIADVLDRPTPAVSQHLAKLRAHDLVATRREGTSIFYTQPDEHMSALVLNIVQHSEHALYAEPPHHRLDQTH